MTLPYLKKFLLKKGLKPTSILTFFLFIFFCMYSSFPYTEEDMGFEYGNIGKSIVEGEGYANVFDQNNGPTAIDNINQLKLNNKKAVLKGWQSGKRFMNILKAV